MVVTFGGIAGGTGRTVVAVHLALMRAASKKRVLLVDTRGCAWWFFARRAAGPRPAGVRCVRLSGEAGTPEMRHLARRFDDVIVDANVIHAEARAVVALADIIVIPLLPDCRTFGSFKNLTEAVGEWRARNSKTRAMAVVNQGRTKPDKYHRGTEYALQRLLPFLKGLEAPPLTLSSDSTAVDQSGTHGLGVHEFLPSDRKICQEFSDLYGYIFREPPALDTQPQQRLPRLGKASMFDAALHDSLSWCAV